ncbi:hypothetical protein [Plantibacter sp. VKM Ac-2876]|uniref:hypothetical protein n=1 Tax=Plantibacter sp. VKM Ac-2876 TaxID=2783826 RepID=UPI00188A9023|nr:hypothetical protein [Plantibacter sp. VKM Ac-2876]MBF4565392.1 hypothetical protein [Plantibacter sp. VKM Ac-2876]
MTARIDTGGLVIVVHCPEHPWFSEAVDWASQANKVRIAHNNEFHPRKDKTPDIECSKPGCINEAQSLKSGLCYTHYRHHMKTQGKATR